MKIIFYIIGLLFTTHILYAADLSNPDPFELLGLKKDCTLEEVKTTYRKLAVAHHPQNVPFEIEGREKVMLKKTEDMKKINLAREIVVDWINAGRAGNVPYIVDNLKQSRGFEGLRGKQTHSSTDWDGIQNESWEDAKSRLPGIERDEYEFYHQYFSQNSKSRPGASFTSRAWIHRYDVEADAYYEPHTDIEFSYNYDVGEYTDSTHRFWFNPDEGAIIDPLQNQTFILKFARWKGVQFPEVLGWWSGSGGRRKRADERPPFSQRDPLEQILEEREKVSYRDFLAEAQDYEHDTQTGLLFNKKNKKIYEPGFEFTKEQLAQVFPGDPRIPFSSFYESLVSQGIVKRKSRPSAMTISCGKALELGPF